MRSEMNMVTKTCVELVLLTGLTFGAFAQQAKAIYENDFEKSALDKVPDDFLVLDGQFAVKEEGGNKFLELPGAPLDTFGVLFGPTEKEDTAVSARIFGTGKGRRYPTFAVGLNGQGTSAYRLQVSPAKKALELLKVMISKAPCRMNGSQAHGAG